MRCPYCEEKISPTDERCPSCGARTGYQKPVENAPNCTDCGEKVNDRTTFCRVDAEPHWQERKQGWIPETEKTGDFAQGARSDRKKWTAFFLCLVFGSLGLHRFYLGRLGSGILYLLTGGVFYIGWLVDLLLILTDRLPDRDGLPLS